MRAFVVAGRAIVSFYADMFVYIGMSLWWWITGGIFVGLGAVGGLILFMGGGPWWVAPLVAIPAGPAILALAAVSRKTLRGRAADRQDYFDALKQEWKAGLALNALGMVVLSLLLLNLIFYASQTNTLLRLLSILCGYLVILWASIQVYVYPFYSALEKPSLPQALRLSVLAAFANPLFSFLLLAVALALTAVSVGLPVLVVIIWPGLMALLGAHALRLLLQRAGVEPEE